MIVKAIHLHNDSNSFLNQKMFLSLQSLEEHFGSKGIKMRISRFLNNGKSTNFWCDMWMIESPLINKVNPYKEVYINKYAKVSDFITRLNLEDFYSEESLAENIIDQIKYIPISIKNFEGKLICKFTSNSEVSIKTAIWTNNISIEPHPDTKFNNSF